MRINSQRCRGATLLVLAALGAVGCDDRPESAGHDDSAAQRPTVVATIFPLAQLTEQLVGDAAEVVCLVPPGVTPHGYEMTFEQTRAVHHARLLFTVGLGFDDWALRAAQAQKRTGATFVFADHVDPDVPASPSRDDHAAAEHDVHDDTHDHDGVDPHLWLDPHLVRRMLPLLAKAITDALNDPAAADAIGANLAQLDARLAELDHEAAESLAAYEGRRIVTFHRAFDRLLTRYGLAPAVTLKPIAGPTEVTPARLTDVIDVMRRERVRVLFTEPQFPADAVRLIADQTGATVLVLDPLGSPHLAGRATYIDMMQYNLRTLTEGLALSTQAAEPR